VNIIYKVSILFAFMSFIGIEMTQAMDDKKDDFKDVNLKKEGNGSPTSSPREKGENNTENKELSSNKPKEENKTPPSETSEKKKCNIF
jgi:hypothetical protein